MIFASHLPNNLNVRLASCAWTTSLWNKPNFHEWPFFVLWLAICNRTAQVDLIMFGHRAKQSKFTVYRHHILKFA